MGEKIKAKIIGIGSYLPEKVLSNFDLEKMVDTSDEWIVTRTGIKERRISKKDEYTSDMAFMAAKRALENAKILPEDIDIIICATLTPDYIFPSTSCILQNKLEAVNSAAMDVQAACTGFIYGLSIAKAYIESGQYKNILVVASEKLSSIIDYEDRSTCVLFGDGAAACVVGVKGDNALDIESVDIGADGACSDLLMLPGGGCRNPASYETVDKKMHFIQMSGNEVFKHAVRRMISSTKTALKKADLEESDITWLIPHQANLRIIEAIAKRFSRVDPQKVIQEGIKKYGNTSASSVCIVLDELCKSGKLNKGDNILLTAFGSGFTWGSTVLSKRD